MITKRKLKYGYPVCNYYLIESGRIYNKAGYPMTESVTYLCQRRCQDVQSGVPLEPALPPPRHTTRPPGKPDPRLDPSALTYYSSSR